MVKILHDEVEREPYIQQNQKILLKVSLGAAHGKENIFEKADMALKYVKKKKIHYYFYDESLKIIKEYENNLEWARRIKNAIEKNWIIPFFQPIVDTKNKKLEMYESLARLIDENGKIYAPGKFLHVAKKSKQYAHITKAIVSNAFPMFKGTDLESSINLSVDDMLNDDTVEHIEDCLKKNLSGDNVIFEILESEGIESYDEVSNFINKMKTYGCKIAIDDFGTGYSNFPHVLKLDVDYIKIDSMLIKDIDRNRHSQIVVRTTVDFCKQLGIETIAEFVHSSGVFETIADLGIDYAQGYYFGEAQEEIITGSSSKIA